LRPGAPLGLADFFFAEVRLDAMTPREASSVLSAVALAATDAYP
jgi:hypothetical protein